MTKLEWLAGDKRLEATFDAVVTETSSRSATVTTHPVEKGADVADHVYLDPLRISLEAVATSTPIRQPPNFTDGARGEVSEGVLKFDKNMERPKDLWTALNAAFKAKSVFTIRMSHSYAENMVMVGLSLPREAGSGHATSDRGTFVDKLTFSIEFQQIRTVSSRESDARKPKATTPKEKKDKGDKQKKQASDDQNRSIAKQIGRSF